MTTQTQMNTPSPTEAHLDLALQIAEVISRSGNVAAARLIADSEARAAARAVAVAVTALTCTNHNDQQRAACPVCLVAALTAERDQLRAERDSIKQEIELVEHRAYRAEAMLADPQQLHSHCLRTLNEGQIAHLFGERMTEIVNRADKAEEQFKILKETFDHVTNMYDAAMVRAERAEAELERLRLELKGAAASST